MFQFPDAVHLESVAAYLHLRMQRDDLVGISIPDRNQTDVVAAEPWWSEASPIAIGSLYNLRGCRKSAVALGISQMIPSASLLKQITL